MPTPQSAPLTPSHRSGSEQDFATTRAVVGAAAMIAFQVAGKATRDSLFLTHFEIASLPLMYSGAAAVAVAMALIAGRAMTRYNPAQLVPQTYLASSLVLLGEWLLLATSPRLTAVLLYLHITVFGGLLISGFWSVINELYDPRSGKRAVARIAGSATAGGLLGGILAERFAVWFEIGWSLPLLAALHLLCAAAMKSLEAKGENRNPSLDTPAAMSGNQVPGANESGASASAVLRSAPYLRNLALLVCIATLANVAIDYAFLASAESVYGHGQPLMRVLAIFYTVVGLLTFAVHALFSRRLLERLGLMNSVGTWPMAMAAAGSGALLFPGLATVAVARAASSIFNDSLFRSGYELLYTPIPQMEKRAAKSLIDTAAPRLGDFLGGGIIRLILFAAPVMAIELILFGATLLAFACLWIVKRIGRGYIASLERNLLNHAIKLDLSDVHDGTTRSALMQALDTTGTPRADAAQVRVKPEPMPADPLSIRTAALRSRDKARVMEALRDPSSASAELIPYVVPLLAWDDAYKDALALLRHMVPQCEAELVAALTDPEQPFAIRRRIPRVLSASATQTSVDGLARGLDDSRFEVRYQSGIALDLIRLRETTLCIAPERAVEAIQREIGLGRRIWESQRLLDGLDAVLQDFADHNCAEHSFVDDVVRDRANRSLEHVFRLLSFLLPREPLRIAFRGLHVNDPKLRGTALEYLETTLPAEVRVSLWPFLEDQRPSPSQPSSREEILDALLRSHESIEINLANRRSNQPLEQPLARGQS